MRFLWMSNAPWVGTGYGVQTRLMLPALRELGHDPVCFAFYGLSGGKITYDGYEILPNSDFEMWGNDVIKAHTERAEAEMVVTLMDLFVLDPEIWKGLSVPWAAWVPIDADGIGHMNTKPLDVVDYPIAMSSFGAMQLSGAGYEPFSTIYHAVDTDTFAPRDRSEARKILNIPEDVFLVGMVMANKGDRKQYPQQLEAIKMFADKNPDIEVRGYLHTEPTAAMGGWDMRALVERMGLKGQIFATNQYDVSVVPMSDDYMTWIYNAFDVLLNCSAGEGFGVPIIEAQACGVPVITQGVTAMPEITINGYQVESQARGLASNLGWQYSPSVEDIAYRLDCVYRMTDRDRRKAGREWVIANCSVPVIARQWDLMLNAVASGHTVDVEAAREEL